MPALGYDDREVGAPELLRWCACAQMGAAFTLAVPFLAWATTDRPRREKRAADMMTGGTWECRDRARMALRHLGHGQTPIPSSPIGILCPLASGTAAVRSQIR